MTNKKTEAEKQEKFEQAVDEFLGLPKRVPYGMSKSYRYKIDRPDFGGLVVTYFDGRNHYNDKNQIIELNQTFGSLPKPFRQTYYDLDNEVVSLNVGISVLNGSKEQPQNFLNNYSIKTVSYNGYYTSHYENGFIKETGLKYSRPMIQQYMLFDTQGVLALQGEVSPEATVISSALKIDEAFMRHQDECSTLARSDIIEIFKKGDSFSEILDLFDTNTRAAIKEQKSINETYGHKNLLI